MKTCQSCHGCSFLHNEPYSNQNKEKIGNRLLKTTVWKPLCEVLIITQYYFSSKIGVDWFEFKDGDFEKISFTNFPDFNSSGSSLGDTLLFHPLRPTTLFIYPFNATKIENFKLQPLCYAVKKSQETCEADFDGELQSCPQICIQLLHNSHCKKFQFNATSIENGHHDFCICVYFY